jgi:hydroxymethylbilane synthase
MFAKEIETALMTGEIDMAVHSAKDLTAILPEGLILGAFGPRKDPRDVLVDRWGLPLSRLPRGARIGTSSPRRTAQLRALRPDLDVRPIRGNVETRLDKSRGDDYDGVVLAAAGLQRLGRLDDVTEYLATDTFTPEVGQGALAVEARASDQGTLALLAGIDHGATNVEVTAERAFLRTLGGGCTVPVAAYARTFGRQLRISAMAAVPDGSQLFRADVTADVADPRSAGRLAAERLLARGAEAIVDPETAS